MNLFAMVTTTPSAAYTPYALDSFFRHTPFGPDDQFHLIDNDGTFSPSTPLHPAVRLISNHAPRSFAANMNLAMNLAAQHRADLFFLNNDLIFTEHWFDAMSRPDPAVLIPLSNWRMEHQLGSFKVARVMDLEQYLGHEEDLAQIVRAHRAQYTGYHPIMAEAFFCVKVPYSVYSAVGALDESFGAGGGEDADYCVRCLLAGFPVLGALQSYLLHFMGKSTWRGGETPEAQRMRQESYERVFAAKWGRDLLRLMVKSDSTVLDGRPEALEAFKRHDARKVIELLRTPPAE